MDGPRENQPTDRQLVDAANAGDDAAFAALYHRHKDWALRLAHRFTGQHADAADVVQETFIYLARKFPGFTLTANLTTFLYPVIKNLSLQVLRKRRPANSAPLESAEAPAQNSAAQADDTLVAVLAHLPEAQCDVVMLRFVDGFSLEEIATVLEVPLGTVKSRLHLALNALREDPRTRDYFF
jgi:RNA polymerase sigma-70 factor, ECF subfamily